MRLTSSFIFLRYTKGWFKRNQNIEVNIWNGIKMNIVSKVNCDEFKQVEIHEKEMEKYHMTYQDNLDE